MRWELKQNLKYFYFVLIFRLRRQSNELKNTNYRTINFCIIL